VSHVPDFDVLRDQALEWIYGRAGGSQAKSIPLRDFVAEAGLEYDAGYALVRDLRVRGLVEDQSAMGDPCASLTPAGLRFVQQFRKQRQDPIRRAVAARNGLLRYLYEQDLRGVHMPITGGILETEHGSFMGDEFTPTEIDRAAEYLYAKGLIKGIRAAQARGPIRARITSNGQDCMEQRGGDVGEYLQSAHGTSITTHIGTLHSSGALAVGSTNVNQTVNINDVPAIIDMIGVLLEALPRLGLPPHGEAAVRAELIEVRDELETVEPRRDRIRGALTRAAAYLGDAGKLINAGEGVAKAWDTLSKHFFS
jgi:hypothetical protein